MGVSVCIPVYNGEPTIALTLDSILAQTYREMNIIVADNASSDATPDIVQRYARQDSRVRHVRFEQLVPVSQNLTRCFGLAQDELMAIYHADDIYRPQIVQREVALLRQRPDVSVVLTRGGRVDAQGALLSPFPIPRAVFSDGLAEFDFAQGFRAALQYAHIFLTPSAMGRTAVFRDEIKEWPDQVFGIAADLYVFLAAAKNHKIAILDEELMDWRASPASMTYRASRIRRERHDMFKALDYLIQNDAKDLMGPTEKANYDFLLLKDDINIAISYLIDGDRLHARKLLPRLLRGNIIASAFRYRQHRNFLLIGYATWLLSLAPLGAKGRDVLRRVRFG